MNTGDASKSSLPRDLTGERKRTEEQLERSNQKLNEILASIQDDLYVIDRDWNFVYANQLFASKLGKEPEDFIGNNVWTIFPKHVGTVLEENFRAAMEKRETRRFEIRGRYTDAWYRMTVFPSVDGITILGTDVTESKRAEEQLRSQATLLSIVNDAIVASDAQFIITSWNSAAEALYGWKAEEVMGRSGPDILETEWPGKDAAEMRRIIAETGHWRGEVIQARKDGSRFPVELSSVVLYDDNHQIVGYASVNRDITERKQAEKALRESEERLRQMIETSPVAIAFRASTGKIFDANMSFYRMTGYSREEIQASQLGWNQLTAPEYAELDRQIMTTLAATGSAGPYEKEYIRKDGTRVPLLLTLSKLPGRDEHIAFVMDITEHKRAEEQLRELSQRLTYHVDNSPLAVIEWGADMRLVRWSGTAEQIFGWKAEEVLGKRIEDFCWVYEEDIQKVNDVSMELQMGRNSQHFSTNRNYRKDGSVAYCEWYNSSLMDKAGKLRSILSLVLDVTERKRAEDALRENQKQLQMLNETLEQKVQEKTLEVRRLAADLVKAEQRERRRISRILHEDLQQRIYAIQMQLSFLSGELQENEIARQEVSSIEKQLGEIVQIARHLSIDLNPPILPEEGLSHAVNWLASQMQQRYGLPIEVEADGPFAIPDEELHVLLFNCIRELLFNVVKHAEASQAAVVLQSSDASLRIEVRDDGKGFLVNTPEQQGNGEMHRNDHDQPLSLGLPTARHQLSLFSGRMEVESKLGAGTRIILIVPVAERG
jgi:PAS domain S-box-containing protein